MVYWITLLVAGVLCVVSASCFLLPKLHANARKQAGAQTRTVLVLFPFSIALAVTVDVGILACAFFFAAAATKFPLGALPCPALLWLTAAGPILSAALFPLLLRQIRRTPAATAPRPALACKRETLLRAATLILLFLAILGTAFYVGAAFDHLLIRLLNIVRAKKLIFAVVVAEGLGVIAASLVLWRKKHAGPLLFSTVMLFICFCTFFVLIARLNALALETTCVIFGSTASVAILLTACAAGAAILHRRSTRRRLDPVIEKEL